MYKPKSTTELENYHPISVLPIVSKITECEVHGQLYEFRDETKLIQTSIWLSTELAAIALLDQVRLAVDNGNLVGTCFTDLQKVFDTINHNKLI